MIQRVNKNEIRGRIHKRIRSKLRGTAVRPRLAVFRSLSHIYAQVIDDSEGRTLVAASSSETSLLEGAPAASAAVIAERPIAKAEKPEKGEKAEKGEKPEKGAKVEKGEKAAKGEKGDKAEKEKDEKKVAAKKPAAVVKASGGNIPGAMLIGKTIADRAKEKGIKKVVFDRGGYIYHGRVKALADAARAAGLEF